MHAGKDLPEFPRYVSGYQLTLLDLMLLLALLLDCQKTKLIESLE